MPVLLEPAASAPPALPLTLPARGILKGSVQNTFLRASDTRDAFTAGGRAGGGGEGGRGGGFSCGSTMGGRWRLLAVAMVGGWVGGG